MAALGAPANALKEGFIEGMTDEEKQEKKNERLQKKLEEQVEEIAKMDEAIDSTREELDTVEGMPEYQDIVEYHKESYELTVRNIIKDCITNNKPLDSKSASIIKNMQMLKALDMVGSGGGVGGGGGRYYSQFNQHHQQHHQQQYSNPHHQQYQNHGQQQYQYQNQYY